METCERCSERECARFHGVQRGRDCYTAGGILSAGPAQGQARAEVCASLIACAYRTSCVSYNELECYCGYGVDPRSCRAQPQGPCRHEYEAAGQTTEPGQILGQIFALDDEDEDSDEVIEEGAAFLLEVASQLVACEAEHCMTMCSD